MGLLPKYQPVPQSSPPEYSPHAHPNLGYSQSPQSPADQQLSSGNPPEYPSHLQPGCSTSPVSSEETVNENDGHNNDRLPKDIDHSIQMPNPPEYHENPTINQVDFQLLHSPHESSLNFTGAIILSCITFWWFGCIFGLIAYILAKVGQATALSGDEISAKQMMTSSYVASAIGIIVGIIATTILLLFA